VHSPPRLAWRVRELLRFVSLRLSWLPFVPTLPTYALWRALTSRTVCVVCVVCCVLCVLCTVYCVLCAVCMCVVYQRRSAGTCWATRFNSLHRPCTPIATPSMCSGTGLSHAACCDTCSTATRST
jgi:hypothetical protein